MITHPLPPECDGNLPWRASLAFAVRCARRVELLATDAVSEALFESLDVAGQWAVIGSPELGQEARLRELLSELMRRRVASLPAAAKAIEAGIHVIRAALATVDFWDKTRSFDQSVSPDLLKDLLKLERVRCWSSATNTVVLAHAAAQSRIDISADIIRDFSAVWAYLDNRTDHRQHHDIFETSVPFPQSLFGVMWPDGLPDWERDESRDESRDEPPAADEAGPPAHAPGASAECAQKGRLQRPLIAELYRCVVERYKREELERICRFGLQEKLQTIAADASFGNVAFALIEWADDRGRLRELAAALMEERLNVPEMVDVCQRIIGS